MVAARHVPADRDIEGLVGEDHARDIGTHEPFGDRGIGRVAADQAMGAEQKQIAYPGNCRGAGHRREIASFASILVSTDYDLIDLVRTKPGNLDWRIGDYEFLEFSFEFANVPGTLFAQAIDGQSQ